MPRTVHERLRELETDVRDLQVLPAATVRDRGRRRTRRQLAAVAVAGAVVATTAGITVTRSFERPPANTAAAATSAVPSLSCVLALPNNPAEVHIRVLDGGAPVGEFDKTAARLRARTFTVLPRTTGGDPAATTTVRYGPAAIGAATVVRAMVHGEVSMSFDPDRPDDTIDLTLGASFTRLATTTEVNQNLAAAGEPSAPPQC
jgi:hypothetical protein